MYRPQSNSLQNDNINQMKTDSNGERGALEKTELDTSHHRRPSENNHGPTSELRDNGAVDDTNNNPLSMAPSSPLSHDRRPRRQRRRRLSLDNSCLGATPRVQAFQNHLYHIQQDEYYYDDDDDNLMPESILSPIYSKGVNSHCRVRRLSLNNRTSANSTFLATLVNNPSLVTNTNKDDLDQDWHDSLHSKSSNYTGAGSESSSTFSGDSSSSFCQASVEEPANREYIRKDLGASCFWGDDDEVDIIA